LVLSSTPHPRQLNPNQSAKIKAQISAQQKSN